MARSDPQFKLRLPVDLKKKIEAAAKKNDRSMNAEIIARLKSSLKKARKEKEPQPPTVEAPSHQDLLDVIREAMEEVNENYSAQRREETLSLLRDLRQFSSLISMFMSQVGPDTLRALEEKTRQDP